VPLGAREDGAQADQRIRESQKVSQPVFARYLNTSESTVEKVGERRKEAERHGH